MPRAASPTSASRWRCTGRPSPGPAGRPSAAPPAPTRPDRRRTGRRSRPGSRYRPAPARSWRGRCPAPRRSSSDCRSSAAGRRGRRERTARPRARHAVRVWRMVQTMPVCPYDHSRASIPACLRVLDWRPSHKATSGANTSRPSASRTSARVAESSSPATSAGAASVTDGSACARAAMRCGSRGSRQYAPAARRRPRGDRSAPGSARTLPARQCPGSARRLRHGFPSADPRQEAA